jgi:GTP-binding protein
MLPTVTIIGRPNVGKSTLFNKLTKTKSALVVDFPGTTVDRNYGLAKINEQSCIVIDTAGIDDDAATHQSMLKQTKQAITEANLVLFMVNAQDGLMAEDLDLAKILRKFSKKVILVINKTDRVNIDQVKLDFYQLGFDNIEQIVAKSNRGISKLSDRISEIINPDGKIIQVDPSLENAAAIKVAIVGQPNVGKSTLINTILAEERVVACDNPGTTRDSIYIPTNISGQDYVLIDTAGVRRKAKVKQVVEKFSALKTLQAINDAEVAVMLIDATVGIVEQDLRIINIIIDRGASLIIAINKWDKINQEDRKQLQKNIKRKLEFLDFIQPVPISALYAKGVHKIFKEVLAVFKSATKTVATNKLSELLAQAVQLHQPPLAKSTKRRIKLRYAHLGGHFPFQIIIHGAQVDSLGGHYRRYLSNFFREQLNLKGTVVQLTFKNSHNPYV